jgi:phage terminase Nu1 subunit (DNA packaging protein)
VRHIVVASTCCLLVLSGVLRELRNVVGLVPKSAQQMVGATIWTAFSHPNTVGTRE